jgi:hypothetical protein
MAANPPDLHRWHFIIPLSDVQKNSDPKDPNSCLLCGKPLVSPVFLVHKQGDKLLSTDEVGSSSKFPAICKGCAPTIPNCFIH